MKYVALQDRVIINPEDGKPMIIAKCLDCPRQYRVFYRPDKMPVIWDCECGVSLKTDCPEIRALPVR